MTVSISAVALFAGMLMKNNVIDNPYHIDRYVYLKERNKSKALKIVRDRIAKAKAEREGL